MNMSSLCDGRYSWLNTFYLQKNFNIHQHRSIQERHKAAKMLSHDFDLANVNLFMDTMDNNTNEKYAALPERLFILHEGKISYIGGVGPVNYHPEEVENWLQRFERRAMKERFDMFKYSQKTMPALPRED